MALLLNLETATTVCSVALSKEGNIIASKEINSGYTHSENITLFIQDVFSQSKIYSLSDLDAIAVSKGPGSYTGLRIGVSTAKGLCYALNKPLLAINTLQAMTHFSQLKTYNSEHAPQGVLRTTLLCPMIDARRMEVYCAIYDLQGNEIKPTAAEIITEDSFSDILKNRKIIFFGDGARKCKEILSHQANAVFIDTIFPSAVNMLPLAEKAYQEKQFEDVAYFEPFYLKEFLSGKKAISSSQ